VLVEVAPSPALPETRTLRSGMQPDAARRPITGPQTTANRASNPTLYLRSHGRISRKPAGKPQKQHFSFTYHGLIYADLSPFRGSMYSAHVRLTASRGAGRGEGVRGCSRLCASTEARDAYRAPPSYRPPTQTVVACRGDRPRCLRNPEPFGPVTMCERGEALPLFAEQERSRSARPLRKHLRGRRARTARHPRRPRSYGEPSRPS
jgi:hypothetical protein